jgi:site-specific DNA recombinase
MTPTHAVKKGRRYRYYVSSALILGEPPQVLRGEAIDAIELHAEARLRRAGKGIRLIVAGGQAAKPDGQLIALLRNAFATRDALMSGRDATIDALAQRLGVKRDYLSAHLLRLTYLAPGVVKDLFEGRQPEALTAARLVSLCKDLPHDWQLQQTVLGFESR